MRGQASRSESRVVCLQETLDLPAAAPLAATLTRFRGQDLVIDASRVQYLGAQCLQVLLSAAISWNSDGIPLRVTNRATAFTRSLELAGIETTKFAE